MAKFQIGLGADDYEWLPDALRLESLGDITATGPTNFIYTNDRGDTVTVTGVGFTYSIDGRPTGGTISGIVVTRGVETVMTLSLLNDPLKDYADRLLDDNDPTGAARDLFDGDDEFIGSAEADTIGGFSPGDDTVEGNGGHDWLAGDEGKDHLDGGNDDGFDILSYSQTYFDKSGKKGVVLKVGKGSVKDPWGDKDTFENFEGFWGTRFDDKLIGTNGEQEFAGLGGEDQFIGKGGWDRLDYSHDNDYPGKKGKKGIKADFDKGEVKDGFGDIDKFKGIEQIRGTEYKDVFVGSNNNESFEGLAGKDKYDGGDGFDRIELYSNDFNGGLNGIIVDVSKGKILDDGYGNVEKFKSIESFQGTAFGDTFIGSNKDDEFKGEGGNDTMTGGGGGDKFVFNPAPDSATNNDVITDFNEAQGDRIALWKPGGFPQLNEIDGGLDPDQFIAIAGGIPDNAARRIVYDTSTGKLWLDPDGNASAGDQVLIATLTNKPTITAEAFEVWI
jgi:Ca2+-binding RTX toxin-like protein